MYRNTLFDNPIVIVLLFFIVSTMNILTPVHFITILFAGVLFMAFKRCLEKQYYYSLVVIIATFVVIELSHGLKLFSISLISFFIYLFIAPNLKQILSSQTIYTLVIISLFYVGLGVLFYFFGGINSYLTSILIINYFIDLFIVSLII